ncbi:hypothetical protein B0H66DRAFT_48327 [Apodospora peruviana]|uniref:Zn(2)-C6 fungal-type domain-containing protein n=1 Tax=Apodospora peruviana TaxID=516989 RepID=A0AAE0IS26_9PEZI|nr:hypothetical protein B0H66DRAFT_48327 [Apodospora peruviana]
MALPFMPIDDMLSTSVSPSSTTSKAVQACISCRKQKRKCDKTLPMCGLCARMGRQCDYTDAPNPPTADDLASLQSRLAELESRLMSASSTNGGGGGASNNGSPSAANKEPSPANTTGAESESSSRPPPANSRGPLWMSSVMPSNFPSAIFLDIDCFKWASMPIPKPNVDLPQDVYEILTHGTTVQEATALYFDSVHPWFPIISRKRMSIGTSLWEGGPDLAMLFLAMKLITSPVVGAIPPADSPLYTASKRFLALLESSGALSLLHLQAMVLVTLYEMGHGIYPPAWVSVAMCARYVDLVGIPSFKESSTMLGSVQTTWTELEERRRVWWGVYILDRIMSLGNKKRCTMPEPEDHFLLPVDDDAWDAGDPARSLQNPITTPLYEPQAPFARLAQAGMLISNILTHCRARIAEHRHPPANVNHSPNNHKNNPDLTSDSVINLLETVDSFSSVMSSELLSKSPTPTAYFARLVPRCLAASACILFLDAYACPENLCDGPSAQGVDSFSPKTQTELNIQIKAVEGLKSCSFGMRDISLEVLEAVMMPDEQRRVSPLCLDALYGSMASLHWLWKESGSDEIHAAMEDVRNCLQRLAMRWRLAGEYLDMIHYHDVTMVMALRANFS